MEFLVEIATEWPPDGDPEKRDELIAAENQRAMELAEAGILKKLWRIPGTRRNVGIWEAPDATALHAALGSLRSFHGCASTAAARRAPNDPRRGR